MGLFLCHDGGWCHWGSVYLKDPIPSGTFLQLWDSCVTSGTYSLEILVICGDPVPLWGISVTIMWVSVFYEGFYH